jgi:hypothetical protein
MRFDMRAVESHSFRRFSRFGKRPSREVQNPAGRKLDRASIAGLVEPEADAGGPTDAQGMASAASELADRTYSKTWTPVLTKVLFR